MDMQWYQSLAQAALLQKTLPLKTYRTLLISDDIELLPLIEAAFQVRKQYHGREVTIHVINNVQNGLCSEDCSYCAQSRNSKASITKYATKSDQEIIEEAKRAYEVGAHRYCMVYAGRSMKKERIKHLCSLIRTIKQKYPIELCVSAGILDQDATRMLKEAGLDRLNHNLNTAASRYDQICTTHTFSDRLNTLAAARKAGLEVCSGIIAGMGETANELIELAITLRSLDVRSIPINFLLPIKGNILSRPQNLTPQYCLKILCLFRFIHPTAEIRVAAGREKHLRSMEVMSLYPANSLFMDGYLNTKGAGRKRTLEMIRDAGFTIKSDKSLTDLLGQGETPLPAGRSDGPECSLKSVEELRPALN